MECLAADKLPEGPDWLYEILCVDQHKISYVACAKLCGVRMLC